MCIRDSYWRPGVTHVNEIIFHVITDPTTRLQSLESNEIQFMYTAEAGQINQLKAQKTFSMFLQYLDVPVFIMLNTDAKPLNNLKLRQALEYGTSQQQMCIRDRNAPGGSVTVTGSGFPTGNWNDNTSGVLLIEAVSYTHLGFTGASAVDFGSKPATDVTVNSDTSLTATSPAGGGTVNVTVTTAGVKSATSTADQFTYVAIPTVTSVSPDQGPLGGGTVVTISGTSLTGATKVHFGSKLATDVTVSSDSSLTATSPAGTGTVHVTVTVPTGTSLTSAADEFTYVVAPTVTGVSPTSGPNSGGTTVNILSLIHI